MQTKTAIFFAGRRTPIKSQVPEGYTPIVTNTILMNYNSFTGKVSPIVQPNKKQVRDIRCPIMDYTIQSLQPPRGVSTPLIKTKALVSITRISFAPKARDVICDAEITSISLATVKAVMSRYNNLGIELTPSEFNRRVKRLLRKRKKTLS